MRSRKKKTESGSLLVSGEIISPPTSGFTYNDAETKAHPPYGGLGLLMEAGQYDQRHDAGNDKPLMDYRQHLSRVLDQLIQTKSMAKSVLIATRMPLLFRTYALSSEASAALVPQTGYSPPAPKPATPRPTIIIQKSLLR
jgi:hypothetical protein